jgi:outer membrane protein assembly factor BamB
MIQRLAALCLLVQTAMVVSADWPQFMGPARNGRSAETGLAHSWPTGGPPQLWRVDMGKGFGGAAVVGDRVYVQDREGEERDLLRCLDLNTGKELWRVGYTAPGKFGYPGSRSVPAIAGDRAFCCGPLGHLICVDLTTRKIVWQRHIWKDFGGGKRPLWAFSQNPLVLGDLVIVQAQTPKAGMVAFEAATGKVKWQSEPLGDRPGYVSPAVVVVGGKPQLVSATAGPAPRRRRGEQAPEPTGPPKPTVLGLDSATGQVLWQYAGWQCQTPACVPLDLGDGKVLLSGGYNSGTAIIQISAKGDGSFQVKELLRSRALGSHVHAPFVIGQHVYGNSSDNGRKDGMVCMGLDGKLAWKTKRAPAFDKGGLLYADGMLISVDGQKGLLRLIDPNPEKLTILAEADVLDTPQCWAPLALANGRLLLRDQKQLKCLDLRVPKRQE